MVRLVFMRWTIIYANEWEDFSYNFGEGAGISRPPYFDFYGYFGTALAAIGGSFRC